MGFILCHVEFWVWRTCGLTFALTTSGGVAISMLDVTAMLKQCDVLD